jgi:hypothetical protein
MPSPTAARPGDEWSQLQGDNLSPLETLQA